jgi:hypothetical protein
MLHPISAFHWQSDHFSVFLEQCVEVGLHADRVDIQVSFICFFRLIFLHIVVHPRGVHHSHKHGLLLMGEILAGNHE